VTPDEDVFAELERRRAADHGKRAKQMLREFRALLAEPCRCGHMSLAECTTNPACVLKEGPL
jgi:hypothetical protein